MKRRIAFLSIFAVLLAACGEASSDAPADPVSAQPSPTKAGPPLDKGVEMTSDPVGDPVSEVPGYLDALAAGVSKGWGVFHFVFEVAEPIPASFEVPLDFDAALWSFCVDTDPSSAPDGYPFVAMGPVPCDFIVMAVSEGGEMKGELIDRRPIADGGDAETLDIRVEIDGALGRLTVPIGKMGKPKEFDSVMATSLVTLPLPNDDFIDLDEIEHSYSG